MVVHIEEDFEKPPLHIFFSENWIKKASSSSRRLTISKCLQKSGMSCLQRNLPEAVRGGG